MLSIAEAIISALQGLGLSLSCLHGQGYDGASTISGAKCGVQARIREHQPMKESTSEHMYYSLGRKH